jgi:hypothetical protein
VSACTAVSYTELPYFSIDGLEGNPSRTFIIDLQVSGLPGYHWHVISYPSYLTFRLRFHQPSYGQIVT